MDAFLSVVDRYNAGKVRGCPECRRPFVTGREHRKICPECKEAARETRDRRRTRQRTSSGRDAFRKSRERRVTRLPPEPPQAVNEDFDKVLSQVGTPRQKASISRNHVHDCKQNRRVLLRFVRFLEGHGEADLAVRLLASAKPLK